MDHQKNKNDIFNVDTENDSDSSTSADDKKTKNDTKVNDVIYNDSDTSISDDEKSDVSKSSNTNNYAKTKLNFIICELCGLEFSKKKHGSNMHNTWRNHMYIKHLKKPIDKAIEDQNSKSFSHCPIKNCDFQAKTPDKRLVALHYIGTKHSDVLKKLIKNITRNASDESSSSNKNSESEDDLEEKTNNDENEFATEKKSNGIKTLQIRLVRLKKEDLTMEQELQIKQESIPKISKFEIDHQEMNFRENNDLTKISSKKIKKEIKNENDDQSTPKRNKRPRPKCKKEQSEKNDDSPRIPKRLKTEKDHDNQMIVEENDTIETTNAEQTEKKKRFSCDSCGKLFSQLFSVQQHFKKNHKGNTLAYSKIQVDQNKTQTIKENSANNDSIKMDTSEILDDEEIESYDLDVALETEMNNSVTNNFGDNNPGLDKKFSGGLKTTVKITLGKKHALKNMISSL